jgi:hypothetical protein
MPAEDTSTDLEGQEPEGDEQDTDEAEIEGLDAKSKIQKVNKEAQALRKRAKAAEDRLAEIDAANKTDAEKAADRLADAEKRATEAEARAARLEVAAAKGLTPSQAKRLQGSTVEELEADADELSTDFKPADDGQGMPRRKPRELSSGNDPDDNSGGAESLKDMGASMFTN